MESETEGGDLAGIDVTIKVFGRISVRPFPILFRASDIQGRFQILIAQLIIIWRTWILWSTSVAVRVLIAFLAFTSCGEPLFMMSLIGNTE